MKARRDIIIEQNRDVLAEAAQKVHEAERAADGIAIGVHMSRDHELLRA